VVGVDVAPEAVEVATRQAAARGIRNAEFRVAELENLPFAAGSFEIVTCRFVFHHFSDPGRVLGEMKRVLAPGGRIMLFDILTSEDDRSAEIHNRIERTRDPSHVRMLQAREFVALFAKTGLVVRAKDVLHAKREFQEWMEIVGTDETTVGKTRALFESVGESAGLGMRIVDGRITFLHTNVAWLLAPG
jgi:ubiquinone/menaquinone biosynthesis C-methylase UbiE